MSQPRYQIFVSSTFKDLQEERQAVLKAILELNQFPAGMEIFPAVNDTAWEHIEKVIKDSDYYVLIIGGKYGSIDSGSGLSYTEKEYEFAVSQNIPVLAFTHSDENSIEVGKAEMDSELRDKLNKFKQKVGNKHHWKYWKSINELKANVLSSLAMAFATNPQTGWVKAGSIDKEELLEQFAKLQKKLDELHIENKKLKQIVSSRDNYIISQGDKEIFFNPSKDYFSSHQIVISWNSFFLEVARILVDKAKLWNYYFMEELTKSLFSNYQIVELAEPDEADIVKPETAMNQLVALDLIKASFDRKENLCWALTEKGRKVYSLQTAIKFKED